MLIKILTKIFKIVLIYYHSLINVIKIQIHINKIKNKLYRIIIYNKNKLKLNVIKIIINLINLKIMNKIS